MGIEIQFNSVVLQYEDIQEHFPELIPMIDSSLPKKKKTKNLFLLVSALKIILPPLPPCPPEGPPLGTNFSRRNATAPSPPLPAFT